MVAWYPILAVLNLLAVVVQYVFNALSGSGPDGTIFLNTTGDLSDKYYTEITPAGWTFSIWGIIYTLQASWVLYAVINICRKGPSGQPAYLNPQFLPNSLFVLSIIVCGLNITWLITFDREEIEVACATLIVYSILHYVIMAMVYLSLDNASPLLVEQKRNLEIWLTRALVLNGVAIQATWVNIATLLNVQMVMIYSGDQLVGVEDAGTVALSILTVVIAVYVITDLFVLDRYSRYTVTPYFVLVWALGGSISKNWDADKRNSVFTAVLLAMCVILLIAKLVVTVIRHFTRPRFTTSYVNSTLDGDSQMTVTENKA